MKKLICNAFYCVDGKTRAPGMSHKSEKSYEIYMKNIFVSLMSAKLNNEDCDIALVTNMQTKDFYISQLEENGIQIFRCEYGKYRVPDEFKWQYAFYKLQALEYIARLEYDFMLLLDADTYVAEGLQDLWKDAEGRILLYDTRHRISHPTRAAIIRDYQKLFPENTYPVQYGGESICGDRKVLGDFVHKLAEIYHQIQQLDYQVDKESGDELLISIAAEQMHEKVRTMNPYVERFWNRGYYSASSIWKDGGVVIWHFPADKRYGMIDMYHWYEKYGRFPDKRKAGMILNLPPDKPAFTWSMLKYDVKKLLRY